jgi:hypothetical protein
MPLLGIDAHGGNCAYKDRRTGVDWVLLIRSDTLQRDVEY